MKSTPDLGEMGFKLASLRVASKCANPYTILPKGEGVHKFEQYKVVFETPRHLQYKILTFSFYE
jgi:hypothetical protein